MKIRFQTVSNEDGFIRESCQQGSLNIPNGELYILHVTLCYPRKSAKDVKLSRIYIPFCYLGLQQQR